VTSGGVDPARRDRLVIVLAYALAWGALLVNRGMYWDDWTLVGQSPAQLLHQFSELGLPWAGFVHVLVEAMPSPGLVGHGIVFAVYLLGTLLLHAILRRVPGLGRVDALVAALTFALLPVNYARIALIDLPYGLSLLAFLGGTWVLIRFLEAGGLGRRLVALGLFLCAFTTASLLVLYVVPLALAAVIARRTGATSLRSLVLRHLDFVLLPVAFWLVKSVVFAPGGVYSTYNALTPSGLAAVPQALLSIPSQVLVEPIARAVAVAGVVGLAAGVLAVAWLLRRSRVADDGDLIPAPALALAGVVVLGLGVFAYLAVGRTPVIWDWSSRHQLLVPLGVGLLVAAAMRGARGAGLAGPAVAVAVGLLLGVSAVADARTLIAYQLDWFKQTALIDAARTIPELRTARHIRVVDTATAFNALRRTYRFYEYNALLSVALGDTRRLAAADGTEPSPDDLATFIARPAYHMQEYVPSPVDLELRVSARGPSPGVLDVVRLVFLEATGSPSFGPEVDALIDVEAAPVTPAPVPAPAP
jgi:hypothetical protein